MESTNEVKMRIIKDRRFNIAVSSIAIVALILIVESLLANLWLISRGY